MNSVSEALSGYAEIAEVNARVQQLETELDALKQQKITVSEASQQKTPGVLGFFGGSGNGVNKADSGAVSVSRVPANK